VSALPTHRTSSTQASGGSWVLLPGCIGSLLAYPPGHGIHERAEHDVEIES